MAEESKYPPVKEKSVFYQRYSRVSTISMLMDLGFSVSEAQIDNEDIVYMEQYKEFLLNKGIVEEKVPFKREFVAEYRFIVRKQQNLFFYMFLNKELEK